MNVQHWLDDAKPGEADRVYESVICKACTRLHFIDSATGRLLGEDSQSRLRGD